MKALQHITLITLLFFFGIFSDDSPKTTYTSGGETEETWSMSDSQYYDWKTKGLRDTAKKVSGGDKKKEKGFIEGFFNSIPTTQQERYKNEYLNN